MRVTVGNSMGSGTLLNVENIDGTKYLGYVLTCKHVAGQKGRDAGLTFCDGRKAMGHVWSVDTQADLALIVFWAKPDMAFATVAEASPQADAQIVECGYPGGRGPRLSLGKVRQYTTAGNGWSNMSVAMSTTGGDSGSGVFNADGKLVGVLWGGPAEGGIPAVPGMSECVALKEIHRFLELRCASWFKPRQPANPNPPTPTMPNPGPAAPAPQPPQLIPVEGKPGRDGKDGRDGADGKPGSDGKPADESKLGKALDIAEKVEPIAQIGVPLLLTALGVSLTGPVGWAIAGAGALLRLRRAARGSTTPPAPPAAGVPPSPLPTPPIPNGGTQADGGLLGRLASIETAIATLLNRRPAVVINETPAPAPQRVEQATQYVQVDRVPDDWQAMQVAFDEYAKKYPGSVGTIETLKSWQKQIKNPQSQ